MKCKKCGVEMQRVDLEHVEGNTVFVELECPVCHCRVQEPREKPAMP